MEEEERAMPNTRLRMSGSGVGMLRTLSEHRRLGQSGGMDDLFEDVGDQCRLKQDACVRILSPSREMKFLNVDDAREELITAVGE